jgi:hypothetical protein
MQWRYLTLVALLGFFLAGCSNSEKTELSRVSAELTQVKTELAQLKDELAKLRTSISSVPHTGNSVTLEGGETIDATDSDNLVMREKLIYYKTPFDSPPYLTITAGRDHAEIQDQKADSFKLLIFPRGISASIRVSWKAEGRPKK